jgi:hypothetical protein
MNRLILRIPFLFVLTLIIWTSGDGVRAQDTDTKPADVEFRVQTTDGRTRYRIGEIIPLKLSFTSTAPKKYQINMASYDRSGRMHYEGFHIEPKDGWSDPLKLYFSGGFFLGGGLTGFEILSETPRVISLDLNEWVRFDKPGKYTFYVISGRVGDLSNINQRNGESIELASNELQITITSATKSCRTKH